MGLTLASGWFIWWSVRIGHKIGGELNFSLKSLPFEGQLVWKLTSVSPSFPFSFNTFSAYLRFLTVLNAFLWFFLFLYLQCRWDVTSSVFTLNWLLKVWDVLHLQKYLAFAIINCTPPLPVQLISFRHYFPSMHFFQLVKGETYLCSISPKRWEKSISRTITSIFKNRICKSKLGYSLIDQINLWPISEVHPIPVPW